MSSPFRWDVTLWRWLAGVAGVAAFAGALGATAVLAELVDVLPAHPPGWRRWLEAAAASFGEGPDE